ncbi:ABC transporter permease, partial [Cetobacterium sp.]|uniref:ABC transporter permease n=1 Tax=Cetobacterium sp. TaxID=2071632 RepID=UPI003F35C11D
IQVAAGRNFIPLEYESGENIIVIDNITATQLYGSPSQALNRIIRISKDWDKSLISYRVIGVMKNPIENLITLMGEEDFPRFVRVPLKTYEKNFSTLSNKYITLIVESKVPKNLAQDMKDIKVILNSLTNTKNLYEVNVKNTGAESFEQILKFLNLFISIVASISIIVGGIGIMNIMLVNIIERTNEIGIRKAIGATNLDILILFLLESITLSFIGSFIGIFLGICLSLIIGYFIGVQPIFNYFFILFLMLVSIFIGVVFGVFPAIKASKLDPVEALRK